MKTIFLSAVILCFALSYSPAVAQDPAPVNKAEVIIDAPSKVKIGDLITIDLSKSIGTGFDFKVIPLPPGLRVFNDGRVIVCGTGAKNIEYLFVISCALEDASSIKTHAIQIYGAVAPGPPPNPGENLVDKVVGWCENVESLTPRDDAMKLAQSFASLAIIADQGGFTSPADLVKATATSNREALNGNLEYWTSLLDSLMSELKALAEAGKLPDTKSHAPIWRDVAKGLRAYAAGLE